MQAQEYVISNAFPAKDKQGNEKTWSSQYGEFKVWNLYFENDDTKYQTNKKVDFQGFQKGEVVYGTVGEDRFGNATFKSEQRPMGQQAPQQARPQPQQQQSNGNLEQKVDYLISLMENFLEHYQGAKTNKTTADVSPTDIDDGPVDLSQIDY